jgi:hypothetical protein
MRKSTKKRAPLPRWRIVRLKATPAATIGTVEAPDADSAIREAIKEFDIKEPWQQQKLAARRVLSGYK